MNKISYTKKISYIKKILYGLLNKISYMNTFRLYEKKNVYMNIATFDQP